MITVTMPQAAPTVQPQAPASPKVLVGIPTGGKNVETTAFLRWLSLAQRWGHDGVNVIGTTDGPVAMVREFLCRKFMEPAHADCTHLLMLDTDHEHPVDIVERLSRWVTAAPYPLVVSGFNYQRKAPYRPAVFMWGSDYGIDPLLTWPADSLLQVDAVGASALLVAREVFERGPRTRCCRWTRSAPRRCLWPARCSSDCRRPGGTSATPGPTSV